MKILKAGTPPSERWYEGKCYSCLTEVEFQAKEAKLQVDQRDGDYLKVTCPICSHAITVQASKYKTKPTESASWKDI